MKYLYYPGCSLKGTGMAYEESILEVFKILGVEIEEIKDWNCCGATAYMSVDDSQALILASRNFAMAEGRGEDVVAPCSACYLTLSKANRRFQESPQCREKVEHALEEAGLKYQGKLKIRHPLDILFHDITPQAIAKHVKKPLKGFKVAPYYGCQVVRPYATFDDQFHPMTMDKILSALGAEVVPYSLKTKCCSGSQGGAMPEVTYELVHALLREARRVGANAMATVCPLCQFNLEGFQDEIRERIEDVRLPVLYLPQLMGLAFGLDEKKLGIQRNFSSIQSILAAQKAEAKA